MSDEILPLIDFSKVKKKRRQEEPENDEELEDFLSVKKKGKKKKNKPKDKAESNNQDTENEDPNNTNGAYPYDVLLKRLFNTMKAQKDNSSMYISIPNLVLGVGANDRTTWVNFAKVAEALRRSKEHLYSYVISDLNIDATLGGEGQIYFKSKQKVTEAMLRNVLDKYYNDYIKCPNCKSFKTILRKDQSTRLPQIYCEVCKGEKTIQTIKSRGGGGKKRK